MSQPSFVSRSFSGRSDRRECGGCKVHFASHLNACPNCGRSREDSVVPRRRFAPGGDQPKD